MPDIPARLDDLFWCVLRAVQALPGVPGLCLFGAAAVSQPQDGYSAIPGWDYTRPWFHGSPLALETLLAGSTITQDERLACVFSHKPEIVSLDGDGGDLIIRHNGRLPGLLYLVDEPLGPADVYPHPRSSMPAGLEWLTRRPLRLRLLGPAAAIAGELLSETEVCELRRRAAGLGNAGGP